MTGKEYFIVIKHRDFWGLNSEGCISAFAKAVIPSAHWLKKSFPFGPELISYFPEQGSAGTRLPRLFLSNAEESFENLRPAGKALRIFSLIDDR